MSDHAPLASDEARGFRCDTGWASELEQRVHDHLEALRLEVPAYETAAGDPYCGCLTCMVREALLLAIPAVLDGALHGLVERT